jgi:hypothetical protein
MLGWRQRGCRAEFHSLFHFVFRGNKHAIVGALRLFGRDSLADFSIAEIIFRPDDRFEVEVLTNHVALDRRFYEHLPNATLSYADK